MRDMVLSLFSALALAGISIAMPASAAAQSHDDQGQARRDMREGNVKSLREIERNVLPKMQGMEYLGPEYDAAAMAYRLKFIRDGRVVFVDVDARSGRILRRSR
ncbi:PepSY domain-containing protein [Altericroceibacterium endophyticum]|uniref:PepSY domain-containing protein n=1 Tax=Altericroceibacterium endophyticum TaxID=1808508 RepID=A0A6I4T271_9SPHN|nr:PepSY domain-containing protein [Altericroceibacterium endophyticum]MXO64321.1 hypothetical protein [Altericroceibacterium endophyticum]